MQSKSSFSLFFSSPVIFEAITTVCCSFAGTIFKISGQKSFSQNSPYKIKLNFGRAVPFQEHLFSLHAYKMGLTSLKSELLRSYFLFLFFCRNIYCKNIYYKKHLTEAAFEAVLIISKIELAPD